MRSAGQWSDPGGVLWWGAHCAGCMDADDRNSHPRGVWRAFFGGLVAVFSRNAACAGADADRHRYCKALARFAV